jgi:hypothetical protein
VLSSSRGVRLLLPLPLSFFVFFVSVFAFLRDSYKWCLNVGLSLYIC